MTRLKKYLPHAVILTFVAFWLYLIRPAWMGELGGTFKTREVPQDYIELKDFINGQDEFFRTFWIPQRQRFGFFSNNHPAIDSVSLVKVASSSAVVDWLNKEEAQEQLARWGVKYVIVPYDNEGELFLEDRKYSKKQRAKIKKQIEKIRWLKEVKGFGRIDVFETPEYRGRFWREGEKQITNSKEQITNSKQQKTDLSLKWEMINPTEYEVRLGNIEGPVRLIFSERFDRGWIAKTANSKEKIANNKKQITKSIETDDGLNSFRINNTGNLNITVKYKPQKYVNYGVVISLITLLFAICYLLFII